MYSLCTPLSVVTSTGAVDVVVGDELKVVVSEVVIVVVGVVDLVVVEVVLVVVVVDVDDGCSDAGRVVDEGGRLLDFRSWLVEVEFRLNKDYFFIALK